MEDAEKDKLIASLEASLKIARENEERLHTLVQASPFCIHEINLEGKIISMNRAGLNMMSMQDEDEVCGLDYVDFVNDEQKSTIERKLNDAFAGKYSAFEFSPQDSDLIFTSCFAPVFGNDGTVERVMGITEDITAQRKNELELMRSRKLSSIATLAGGIAHDFNNMFTGIFGNLQLAAAKLSAEHPATPYIATANNALDKATRLSNQLLTFAKGGEPIFESVNLESVIRESILLALSSSDIKATLALDNGLWDVWADKGQLSQVIDNVLFNAMHAMNDDGNLTVEAKNVSVFPGNTHEKSGPPMVQLSITDDGVGIPEEILDKIFDPYFTTKHSGHGLGLATSHSIITRHNGHIRVESEPGNFTTFHFFLVASKEFDTQQVGQAQEPTEDRMPSARILIMDDEPMILKILREKLSQMGHAVETATDSEKTIELYSDGLQTGSPFDIVILDLTIPGGIGGEAVIQELLRLNSDVKAIVTSGYSTGTVMSNPSDFGFHGRLLKPFTMRQLEELIDAML